MVTTATFAEVLRALGDAEIGLIEQTEGGLLLLGHGGERLVEHYSFYAVFKTPEEFRLVADGRDLGTLPIDNVLSPGMMLIFSGRRWVVQEIHDREKVIIVTPAKAGTPPMFGGDPGDIHDKVIERMFTILEGEDQPVYMNDTANQMLKEARLNYSQMGFAESRIVSRGDGSGILATRAGTMKTTTLALALRDFGYKVERHDGFLDVAADEETPPLDDVLRTLCEGKQVNLFTDGTNLLFEKFHPYLTPELLAQDALSARLDVDAIPGLCADLVPSIFPPIWS